jgi:lathosterol oxidase
MNASFLTNRIPVLFYLLPFVLMMLRYMLVAGLFYLIFYRIRKDQWLHRKIQLLFPENRKILFEIRNSISTIFIFGCIGVGSFLLRSTGFFPSDFTRIKDFASLMEIPVSVVILLFVHDTWFYWTHRMMHLKFIFSWMHKVHHQSTNPSPWAAFSFHPSEAVVEALFLPFCLWIYPFHPLALFIFLLVMILMNVIGHLGFEIFPSWFYKTWVGQWQNTSTHHNMHHKFNRCNFGLYSNFWDWVMGSNHPEYKSRLNEIVHRRRFDLVEKENAASSGRRNPDKVPEFRKFRPLKTLRSL